MSPGGVFGKVGGVGSGGIPERFSNAMAFFSSGHTAMKLLFFMAALIADRLMSSFAINRKHRAVKLCGD